MDDEATRKRREEAAETLGRELNRILSDGIRNLQAGRDIVQTMRFADFEFQVTFHGTPYFGERLFERISLTIDWNNRHPAPAEDDEAPGGAKYQSARDAITALWPDGIPRTAVKDRNRMVVEWCRENKRSIPSERTIERVAADMARL